MREGDYYSLQLVQKCESRVETYYAFGISWDWMIRSTVSLRFHPFLG